MCGLKGKDLLVIFICLITSFVYSQPVTLIDFGSEASQNEFGLDGWNGVLLSDNMIYIGSGNGVVVTGEADELSDFRGVMGTPRQFNKGERIVVTWYNNSDDVFFFTARISFTDSHQPDENETAGNWYTMRSFDDYRRTFSEIQPHSNAATVFNITNKGVHKTDSIYSLVNVNLAIEWGETYPKNYVVCDKIGLYDDADTTRPGSPYNLSAQAVSDLQVEVTWTNPESNRDVEEYLVYVNGEVEGYSRQPSATLYFLEPDTEYRITVSAVDMSGNESEQTDPVVVATDSYNHSNDLINPEGIEYLGAFYLPEEFSWGGEAITYNRDGDGGQEGEGASDGYPGSFFVMNLNQPENGLVGEISVPVPVISESKNIEELNSVDILQDPVNTRPDNINNLEYVDIWRTGLKYLPEENALYSSWNIYYTVNEEKHPTISYCTDVTDLANSTKYGAWYLGDPAQFPLDAAVSDYLFSTPPDLASSHLPIRRLITGRYREGGLSGLGPAMYAFDPIVVDPPEADASLEITTLLEYGPVTESDGYNYPNSIDAYNHADLWRDADWIKVDTQEAVMVIGNKARGDNWYGYYGEHMRHDWVYADIPYPEFYESDPDGKGWRSHNIIPMAVFYNPADLYAVEQGAMESYEPQPYAALRIDPDVFWSERKEIFSACYDEQNQLLYVVEFCYEMEGQLIVHVFEVNYVESLVAVEDQTNLPVEFELCQNYPNPFNPSTTIRYGLPEESRIKIVVYNLLGEVVTTLTDEIKKAGYYEDVFNAGRLASGIYFFSIYSESTMSKRKHSAVRKMMLIK